MMKYKSWMVASAGETNWDLAGRQFPRNCLPIIFSVVGPVLNETVHKTASTQLEFDFLEFDLNSG
jgi:hypothetical protein